MKNITMEKFKKIQLIEMFVGVLALTFLALSSLSERNYFTGNICSALPLLLPLIYLYQLKKDIFKVTKNNRNSIIFYSILSLYWIVLSIFEFKSNNSNIQLYIACFFFNLLAIINFYLMDRIVDGEELESNNKING